MPMITSELVVKCFDWLVIFRNPTPASDMGLGCYNIDFLIKTYAPRENESNTTTCVSYHVQYSTNMVHLRSEVFSLIVITFTIILYVNFGPSNGGWIKINTDGAANTNGSLSVVGGVLRDSVGNWIEEFQRFIGRGSAVDAELWAILHGLEMAQSRGYDKVILETDCMTAVEKIKEGLR
ncbi:hypothetical protein Gogos_009822, partial [Gossypium gossypioides]|nr:hypothetical protein [Gossypium gossypioides]